MSTASTDTPELHVRIADAIGMEVFSNRLLTVTEEMGNTLIRSSFSTNIKERRDCSVGLFDRKGRLIAQAAHIPLHLGSLRGSLASVLARYSVEAMAPGTAYICNDPYLGGGTHMPDIALVTPVFVNGEVEFFAANIAHHSDVGGAVPGSISASAKTVFEEGIRIPPVKVVENGVINEELLLLISQNTREPEERVLDLKVQIATNDRGARSLEKLVQQMGLAEVRQAIGDILGYTEQRLRNRIKALQGRRGHHLCYLDDDGVGGGPVAIATAVSVENERLVIDFEGTAPQAASGLNMTMSALEATVFYAAKALLDPGLMPNEGMMQAIEIRARPGLIVNAEFPAAVGARSISCQKVARAIFGAFNDILPEDARLSAGNDDLPTIVFSGRHTKRDGTYVYLETIGGGAPASAGMDGMDGVHVHVTNTSNLPVEALENEYPLFVDAYGLVDGSGGPGRHRGGMGIVRQITALQDGTIFSARSDGHKFPAGGVNGGGDGMTARLVRNHGRPDAEPLGSKVTHLTMKRGENFRIETPGAGGFGSPRERDRHEVERDYANGVFDREKGKTVYGV